jgi:uncharacterized protein YkwD
MKVRFVGLVALCCALIPGFSSSSVTSSQTQNIAKGSGRAQAEQDLLTEINQARANPGTYATYLEKLKPLFKGKEYRAAGRPALTTEEGWAAVEEAIVFLRATKPLAPLNESAGLNLAALAHIKDQGGSGSTGHAGSNQSLIEQRVKPFGTWQGAIGENLTYGNDSARERILTWLIDDGFASRGHRKRLLSTDYKVAGLACGPHPQFQAMCCLTLAGGFTELAPAKSDTKPTNNGAPANNSKPAVKAVKSGTQ